MKMKLTPPLYHRYFFVRRMDSIEEEYLQILFLYQAGLSIVFLKYDLVSATLLVVVYNDSLLTIQMLCCCQIL